MFCVCFNRKAFVNRSNSNIKRNFYFLWHGRGVGESLKISFNIELELRVGVKSSITLEFKSEGCIGTGAGEDTEVGEVFIAEPGLLDDDVRRDDDDVVIFSKLGICWTFILGRDSCSKN
ncbi:hypothetical protein GQX74_007623 [Glossina fuscipes]|nr:hypothetical protein GQX74_007623 [Glossina fuscipes]